MSQLTPIDPRMKTMSTREIAELTGKKIGHVNRDADQMISALKDQGVDDPELDHVRIDRDARGYITSIALPQGLSITLVTGYSVVHRHRIVKRWQELEDQTAPNAVALPNVRQLAQMVIEAEDARERAEGALAIAAPKAAALDLISAGHDTVTITEAAKVLGIKRATLVARMHAEGWIYRQNQSWVAYDQHIKNGRLQYKEARYTDEKTGMECVKPYCHITQKGLAKLAMDMSLVEVAA